MFHADEQTTYVGRWWLPDQPDLILHGSLRIGSRSSELELYESVTPQQRAAVGDRFSPPILHGRSLGSCLTLLANVETGSSTSRRGDGHREVLRRLAVGTALIGDSHLSSEEDCRFNRASLRLSHLDSWVNRTPYTWTTTPESVKVLDLPALTASVPGCEIVLSRAKVSRHGRLTDSGFCSHEAIELQLADRVTLHELEYQFIRPLEHLLTLATGSHCEVLKLQVGVDDDGSGDQMENWPHKTYAVRRKTIDQDQVSEPVIREHMRFGMNSTDYPPNIDFGALVPRWYALQPSLSAVCDWIFSLRSDVGGYLQPQVFTIASALEALHRALRPEEGARTPGQRVRNQAVLGAVKQACPEHHEWLASAIQHAHRTSYASRVRELLQDTSHAMTAVVGDEEKWTRELRDIRDGIGHVLPSHGDRTVEQMVAMLRSAQLFAELVLLHALGFAEAECRRMIERRWELENVRAAVKRGFPQWFADAAEQSGA